MEKLNKKLTVVIEIESSDDIIVKRLTARRVCTKCGKIYGLDVQPKREGVCDVDNAPLYQRDDDKEEVIRERLKVYERQTKPLVHYYNQKGILRIVNGEDPINKILQNILKIVKSKI
jgi:adenylate kinase